MPPGAICSAARKPTSPVPGRQLEHLVARLERRARRPSTPTRASSCGPARSARARPALGLLAPAGAALLAVVVGVGHVSSRRSSLPEGVRGSCVDELERLRDLVAREPLGAVLAQLGGARRRARPRGTTSAVTDSPHSGCGAARTRAASATRGVLLEHRLDLGGRDVLAAGDDRVALAADRRSGGPASSRRPRSPVRSASHSPTTVGPETRISPSAATVRPSRAAGGPAVSRSPGSASVTVEQASVSP